MTTADINKNIEALGHLVVRMTGEVNRLVIGLDAHTKALNGLANAIAATQPKPEPKPTTPAPVTWQDKIRDALRSEKMRESTPRNPISAVALAKMIGQRKFTPSQRAPFGKIALAEGYMRTLDGNNQTAYFYAPRGTK